MILGYWGENKIPGRKLCLPAGEYMRMNGFDSVNVRSLFLQIVHPKKLHRSALYDRLR